MFEPLTNDEVCEMESWGMRLLHTYIFSRTKARRIAFTIQTLQAELDGNASKLIIEHRELQDKNKRLSSDIREMARDCAKLQKVLLDIGFKVSDVLGREVCGIALDLVGRVSPQNSWKCDCDMWNSKNLDSCCNCGKRMERGV